jgi:alpha-1,6-mannosyltransferase
MFFFLLFKYLCFFFIYRYDKTEDLEPGSKEMNAFTHLFISASSHNSPSLQYYKETHTILDHVEGFSQIALQGRDFPPIKIKTEPKIFLLKKIEPV